MKNKYCYEIVSVCCSETGILLTGQCMQGRLEPFVSDVGSAASR